MTNHDSQYWNQLFVIEKVPGERKIELAGEIDLSNASWLQAALQDEVAEHGDLVLDLSRLKFLDCSGRRAIAQLAAALGERGRLVLRNPTPVVQRVFDLTKIESVVNLVIDRTYEERPTEGTASVEVVDPRQAELWGLLGLAQSMMPFADEASVTLRQPDGLVTPVATGPDAEECDLAQYRAGDGPCVRAAADGRTVMLSLGGGEGPPEVVEAARSRGFRSVLSTPITGENGRPIGGLNLYSRQSDFPMIDEAQAQILAARAALILRSTPSISPEFGAAD